MKKFLVIQHEECTPPGSLIDWFQSKSISPEYYFFSSEKELSLNDFESIVILGGGMNVDQEKEFPWLVREKIFIEEIIRSNKKTLGICLGAQLLAEKLGAEVFKANDWELGWFDVEMIDEKKPMKAFHWHAYQFTLPIGAQLVSSSEACPVQGFMFKNILAYQFHPEANKAWLDLNIDSPHFPEENKFIQNKFQLVEGLKYQKHLESWFFKKLTDFFEV